MIVKPSPQYTVSIHLGASAFSLLITQEVERQKEDLEYLEQPIPLARDIFSSERVKQETIERCVEILESFLLVIKGFGLDLSDITIAAVTNILQEAKNNHVVLNRLEVASGLRFVDLDNGGMTRLILQKVERHKHPIKTSGKVLAAHVGPGNTRILLLNDGQIERYSTYRLGSHRTAEALTNSNDEEYLQLISNHCDQHISTILYDYRKEQIDALILLGSEVQCVERSEFEIGERPEQFAQVLQTCATMTEAERIRTFHLDYHSEDAFLPALQINLQLLQAFPVETYWIPHSSYERGLLADLPVTQSRTQFFQQETLHAARLLAQKYEADSSHYEHVMGLLETFFQQTEQIHHLSPWEFFLLKLAVILHEVGDFVSSAMHHKHSYYLISNSEIFGLDQASINIVALVARYHRHSPPKRTHKEYRNLTRSDQVMVSKLAAILRVVDALDAVQQQRITALNVIKRKGKLILEVEGPIDLNLEKLALQKKGNLFEELYGLELHLENASGL